MLQVSCRAFHSSNPIYTGIPEAIYAIAEVHTSLITATTPLLESFIVEFGTVGAKLSSSIIAVPARGVKAGRDENGRDGDGNLDGEREKPGAAAYQGKASKDKKTGEGTFSE